MSIFDPIRNYFRRAALEGARLDAELDLVQLDRKRISEATNDADTSIPSGWRLAVGGNPNAQADVILPHEYYKIIENSREMYLWHATYGGCIDRLVSFAVGRGMKISAKMRDLEPGEEYSDEEKAMQQRVEAYFQACWEANGMDRKDKEIERRRLRDGDAILSFESTDEGAIASMEWESEELGTVVVPVFRFLDPLRVRDDEHDDAAYGVLFDGDNETPTGYRYQKHDTTDARTIDADKVLHYKGKGDSDWPRGVPYLTRVLKTARRHDRYQDAIEQRLELSNCTVFHIGYESAAAQSSAQSANERTAGSRENDQKRLEPGGILRTFGKTNVNMFTPSVEGARAEDGRAFDLQFARAAGLAENTVSGNAENNNRASIEVAQDPQTSAVEDLQDDHACFLREFFKRCVAFGKDAGTLQAGDVDRCTVDPRPIVTRNAKEEADAMTVYSQHGLSDRTILAKAGYDPDREERQKALEIEKAVERGEKYGDGAPGADQDEEDEREALKRQKAQEGWAGRDMLDEAWSNISPNQTMYEYAASLAGRTLEGDTNDRRDEGDD